MTGVQELDFIFGMFFGILPKIYRNYSKKKTFKIWLENQNSEFSFKLFKEVKWT